MTISPPLFQELVAFLTPLPCFQDEAARRSLLILSGLGKLLPDFDCTGKPENFVTLTLHELAQYGDFEDEPATLLRFLWGGMGGAIALHRKFF